jgi:uncharacterized protein (TIGR03086 family)
MSDQSAGGTADRYRRVAQGFTDRTLGVTGGDWDSPAPCQGWLAKDVVWHLTTWVPGFFSDSGGQELPEPPSSSDDPAEAWTALDTAIQAALDDPERAASEIEHPRVGRHRFEDAVGMFVLGDVLVHTWDLARATGQDDTLDPVIVHEVLLAMEPWDEILRVDGQYGPRVRVPADADEQTRLIAFTGRQP